MRRSFLGRIMTKPPMLFPWVALFHLLMFLYSLWNYKEFPFPSEYWTPVLWLALYCFTWLFVCDLKRLAAFVYIGLTIVHILLQYFLRFESEVALYTPPMVWMYILFSFFILAFFRRFA